MPEAPPRTDGQPACRSIPTALLFIAAALLLLASDLALKAWALEHAPRHGLLPLIPYLLSIAWTENHGAVFGMWQGQRWVFILASAAAVLIIGWFFCTSKTRERWLHFALALILAGALGNLYDRIAFGYVRDMLYLFPNVPLPFGWSWPNTASRDLYPWIFNPADVYLLVGIIIIVLRSTFTKPDASS